MWLQGLTSGQSTASSQRLRCRRRRPRRAKGRQTTRGAAPAVAVLAAPASMIAAPGSHLAAEYPIGPRGIAENDRYQHGHADQHEELAAMGRCRLPDRDALRHDVGI